MDIFQYTVIKTVVNVFHVLLLIVKRSANLFLNLFALMLDSGVPDIALEPDKTVQKVKPHPFYLMGQEACSLV